MSNRMGSGHMTKLVHLDTDIGGDTDDSLSPIWEVLPADLPRHGAMFWMASRQPQIPAAKPRVAPVTVGAAW